MRIIFLLLSAVLIGTSASGQIVKKSKAIGGGITFSKVSQPGYSIVESVDDSQTTFKALPSFGYFVADGLVVGINVGFASSKIEQFSSETKSSSLLVGPLVRYYLPTSNENFFIYVQFDLLFESGKTTVAINPSYKTSAIDFGVAPGLVYFINQHWAVEMAFQGIHFKKTDPNKDVENNEIKNFNIGLNSLLPSGMGFRFHF